MIYASNSCNLQIESTAFAGGRINLATSTGGALTQDIQYHHTDHLGSVRAITNQSGETVEQNAYYPFGSRHTFGNTYAQTTNRFKYNGKEEQTTGNLQYLDYGARMYDSKIARWFVQDPLSEKYYAHSPYNYCVNNPVIFVDPDGNSVYTKVVKAVFKLGKTVYKNGIKSLAQTSSYAEAFADVIGDVNTLFDNEASGVERVLAGVFLLTEFAPISGNDVLDVAENIKFLKFNRSNLRKNLIRLTGIDPKDAQAHHTLPVKFEDIFNRAGINIHDPQYGAWFETKNHQHSSYKYNEEWEAFVQEKHSKEEILDKAKELAKKYGYELNIHE